MGFVRTVVGAGLVLVICGCVSSGGPAPSAAYQKERAAGPGGDGNGFPYLAGGQWTEPLVQQVRMPAHVQGGVFYPEHDELVIIAPGEWKQAGGYPLAPDTVPAPMVQKVQPPEAPAEFLVTDITAMPFAGPNERLNR